jgi:hypothetical protein
MLVRGAEYRVRTLIRASRGVLAGRVDFDNRREMCTEGDDMGKLL